VKEMSFENFIENGGLLSVLIIAGSLFAVQAVMTFLLWRKGDQSYFLKFISYTIAAAAILLNAINLAWGMAGGEGSTFLILVIVLTIAAPIAIGIQVYIFIKDTWLSKEDKG
jgi:O-antigen/teichoic acid export membrane protein